MLLFRHEEFRFPVYANAISVASKDGAKRILILLRLRRCSPDLTQCCLRVLAGRDGGGHPFGAGRHPFSDGVHHAATRSGGRGAAALQPGHQAQVSVGRVTLRRVWAKDGGLGLTRRSVARRPSDVGLLAVTANNVITINKVGAGYTRQSPL